MNWRRCRTLSGAGPLGRGESLPPRSRTGVLLGLTLVQSVGFGAGSSKAMTPTKTSD